MTAIDIVDIFLVALLFYQLYRLVRGTAAMNIFAAIIALYFLWLLVKELRMELFSLIIGQVMGVGMIALVVVFQQEIRRFLLHLGSRFASGKSPFHRLFFFTDKSSTSTESIISIVGACQRMSKSKTGALIVLARRSPLDLYSETGDRIDAKVSSRLLENIFFKNSPLHDGAVIIQNERIHSARCVLPSTDNPKVPAYLGMRHRAAMGITEHTDALVVVVSEERGSISLVKEGAIEYDISPTTLEARLTELVSPR